jgi:methylenetetrahydrofolate dehydrogenase (NADP+) / methenyltetrahydrofolate cyclohydrolase
MTEPTGRLDCQETARYYRELVRQNLRELSFKPGMAVVLGSEDPGSVLYRKLLMKDGEELGFAVKPFLVQSSLETAKLVAQLNQDKTVHGIFVFYPLGYPDLKDDEIMDLVDPGKDIEGLHSINIGYMTKFRKRLTGGHERRAIVPCTSRAVLKVIKQGFGADHLAGKTVLVINDSLRVGRPLTAMVANLRGTPILCHRDSNAAHLERFVRLADVIISAVPVKDYRLPAEWIRTDALCIDLSYEGNFDFEALRERGIVFTDNAKNSVGRVTRAMALLNLTYAAGW